MICENANDKRAGMKTLIRSYELHAICQKKGFSCIPLIPTNVQMFQIIANLENKKLNASLVLIRN